MGGRSSAPLALCVSLGLVLMHHVGGSLSVSGKRDRVSGMSLGRRPQAAPRNLLALRLRGAGEGSEAGTKGAGAGRGGAGAGQRAEGRFRAKVSALFECIARRLPGRSYKEEDLPPEQLHNKYKPFYRPLPRRTAFQWLQLALGSMTLLPLRVLTGTVLVFSCWTSCRVILLGAKIKDGVVVNPWRRTLVRRVVQHLSRVMLWVLGFYRIEHGGVDHSEKEMAGKIIVSNHVSYLDVVILLSQCAPCFVAKGAVSRVPIVGFLAKSMGCIFVFRSRGEPGASVVQDLCKRVQNQDEHSPPIIVFPEGTTTSGTAALLKFKTGAFVPASPVVPIALRYPHSNGHFNPSYESVSFAKHLFVLLSTWSHSIRVEHLDICTPTEREKKCPVEFCQRVEGVMARALQLSPSPLTLHDKLRYHTRIRELQLPEAAAL